MTARLPLRLLLLLALLLLIAGAAALLLRGRTETSFQETFAGGDGWTVGEGATASATISDGVYEVHVSAPVALYLGTYDARFGDGIYEVTATQVAGPLDNGYGMILRADSDARKFYLFEISGDGYVWLGFCEEQCDNQGWQSAPSVRTGLNAPNRLRAVADGATIEFYVNDEPVGRLADAAVAAGAIGVMVETLGQPGVRVQFDDYQVAPLGRR